MKGEKLLISLRPEGGLSGREYNPHSIFKVDIVHKTGKNTYLYVTSAMDMRTARDKSNWSEDVNEYKRKALQEIIAHILALPELH
ncbi:hypothetical protein [Pyrococcus abyssi]|uniref:hypothetical protein n=1 Tax=Pyrococcus abyssi TaxID=29292 RepID=UPI0012FF456C|nr:hypothetical protein [Pyrococcus abyssi]